MISEEDKTLIRNFKAILDRGHYANGRQVTEVYNRVFNKNLASTNCSTCIKKRISQMYNQLQKEENSNG